MTNLHELKKQKLFGPTYFFELFLIFLVDLFSVQFFHTQDIFRIVQIFPPVPWIGYGDVVENDLP